MAAGAGAGADAEAAPADRGAARLRFACESVEADGARSLRLLTVAPRRAVIAGWTGRDAAAIEHHIVELEHLGVPRPSSVPLYYRVAAQLLTQAATIEVVGAASSGEVEPLLFHAAGEWWLGIASDHTDRDLETASVALSKQVCAKPVGAAAWRWRDVQPRQDELELRSRIFEDGRWVTYQQGTLAQMRPLESLRDGAFPGAADGAFPSSADGAFPSALDGAFMTCGTLPAIPNAAGAAIRPAARMQLELHDPRLQRRLVHEYAVQTLPKVA